MSQDLNRLAQGISANRKQKLPVIEKNLEKLKMMKDALQSLQAKIPTADADMRVALQTIDVVGALDTVRDAIAKNELAKMRLNRESMHIGVAGPARQGKSKFLQMLTGLNDNQLPTGDTGFCTASRSEIVNSPDKSAKVYFANEQDFLKNRVLYAYIGSTQTNIGLSPVPANLQNFVTSPLPLPTHDLDPLDQERYNELTRLHDALANAPELVGKISSGEQEVNMDSLRNYVTKDQGDKYHFVVDHIRASVPFDAFPLGSIVYDIPGMNDPQPGIRELMVKTVTEDTDVVFYIRKPASTGDGWTIADSDVVKDLKNVYAGTSIQVADWVQCVLNLDTRPAHDNKKQVDAMLADPKYGFTPIVCDCGNQDAVRSMVADNISRLIEQCAKIDDYRISQATDALQAAQDFLEKDVYVPLNASVGDYAAKTCDFNFRKHLLDFMSDLRGPFKEQGSDIDIAEEIQGILDRKLSEASKYINEQYAEIEAGKSAPLDFAIFVPDRIKKELNASHGKLEVLEKAVRNQREAIISVLSHFLNDCCADITMCYFDSVFRKGLEPNKTLLYFMQNNLNSSSVTSVERIKNMVRQLQGVRYPEVTHILGAFTGLLNFHVTFEGNLLPFMIDAEGFSDLDPELPQGVCHRDYEAISQYLMTSDPKNINGNAQVIFNWLKEKTKEIVCQSCSQHVKSPKSGVMAKHIENIIKGNYKTFVFQLIWGDETDEEWEHVANACKQVLWADELQAAMTQSALGWDWQTLLNDFKDVLFD